MAIQWQNIGVLMAAVKRQAATTVKADRPGLTTAQFAALFDGAVKALNVSNTWLAERMKRDVATISHWRSPTYNPRPPKDHIRRQLEREIGLPEFYLDGGVDFDLIAAGRAKRGAAVATFSRAEWEEEPYETWMDKEEAPDRFDYLLHAPERMSKMLNTADLFSSDYKSLYRLGLIKGAEHAHVEKGRPIPPWLTLRRQQVMNGTYR